MDAALPTHQFVPLIDDDALQILEVTTRILVGEKKGERLGGGDESEGGLFANFLFAVARGVAGAGFHFEVGGEFSNGLAKGFESVGGEGAQGGEPEDAELSLW